ncbi:hypothetical protein CLAIMM_07376 isoform 1 [Cladophialophora immunda]|nr:hypothetical protein CLAIMM_07376 isoform 1 [Cladophialophora immunda]
MNEWRPVLHPAATSTKGFPVPSRVEAGREGSVVGRWWCNWAAASAAALEFPLGIRPRKKGLPILAILAHHEDGPRLQRLSGVIFAVNIFHGSLLSITVSACGSCPTACYPLNAIFMWSRTLGDHGSNGTRYIPTSW